MIIFDSWALLAYFQNEIEGIEVERIIQNAISNSTQMFISVVNLGEIWYSIAKKFNNSKADEIIEIVELMGIKVININWEITRVASEFKKIGGLSYADCFAAAIKKIKQGKLITGDFEFEKISSQISVHQLRKN